MPADYSAIPSVAARAAVRNFMTAKERSFRSAVDAGGFLNDASTLTGVKARLVAWAEGKPGRSGGLFGRSVRTIVGSRRYLRLSNQIRENREASFNNALDAVFASLTSQQRDLDVQQAAGLKFQAAKHVLRQSLIHDPGSVTTRKFTDLAAGVRQEIRHQSLERKEQRELQKLADCIDTGRLTAAMEALSRDERKVAVVALSRECDAAAALEHTGLSAGEPVNLDKINAVKAEKDLFDKIITGAYAEHEPKEEDEWHLLYMTSGGHRVTDYDVDSEGKYKAGGRFAKEPEERPVLKVKKGLPGAYEQQELAKTRQLRDRDKTSTLSS
ncbi:MAG: hypothetical protein OXS28_13700 [Gammaproteobacteria bacterium]|nr:hypothetical protein [Gammaproteobacteria bacterium]